VRAGEQSWDEMFNGYFDFALADEDRTQPPSPVALLRALGRRVWTPAGMILAVSVATGLYLIGRLMAVRLLRKSSDCSDRVASPSPDL